jgi:hypothetical protein
MKMSDTITEIASALCKAQAEIDDATKTGINPVFKSKYADLAALRAVIREPLAKNDLAIMQFPRTVEGKGVEVETMLVHKSGEFMSETLFMPVHKWDAHGIGSGITYGRRYGLSAVLCVASDDDDGNGAVQAGPAPAAAPAKKATKVDLVALKADGEKIAKKGTEALREWYKSISSDERTAAAAFLDELKKAAEKVATNPSPEGL